MATYTTFLNNLALLKHYNITPALRLSRVTMNFAARTLAVGSVHQVLAVPGNSMVIMCWPIVKTAGTTNGRFNLGYGTGAQVYHWGKTIHLDSTGTKTGFMGTSAATHDVDALVESIVTTGDTSDTSTNMTVTLSGADLGDMVNIAPSIDVDDLVVNASVVNSSGAIQPVVYNPQSVTKNLGAVYMTAFVDKAPMAKVPQYFASADTIDVTAAGATTLATGVLEVWAMVLSLNGYF